MLPLDNIKVLDLSARAPGPFCTMTLSDLGAEVLMVEAPAAAQTGPVPSSGADRERAAAHDALRRNKRSIILNLKDPEALQLFHRLAQGMDVVVEGFRPGVAERLGIGYEALKALNPRLVYCSISGYGQDGPYRLLPGFDINYISHGGILGIICAPDGTPVIPNNLLGDLAAGGLLPAVAILTALWARERTGQGQYVDMSITDGSLYLMAAVMSSYFSTGNVPVPGRSVLTGGSPEYQEYRCRDGSFLSLACNDARFWENLCRALGREEFIPRWRDAERNAETIAQMRELFATKSRDEWFGLLADKDIPVSKVYTVDELAGDPQIQERRMLVEVEDRDGRPIPQVGIAPRLAATPGGIQSLGAPPGSHTKEVLRQSGYDEEGVGQLYNRGAVA